MPVTPSIGLVTSAPDRRVLYDNRWLSGHRRLRGAVGLILRALHSSNGRDDLSFFCAGGTHWYVVNAASDSVYRLYLQIKLRRSWSVLRSLRKPRNVQEQGARARGSTARLPEAQL